MQWVQQVWQGGQNLAVTAIDQSMDPFWSAIAAFGALVTALVSLGAIRQARRTSLFLYYLDISKNILDEHSSWALRRSAAATLGEMTKEDRVESLRLFFHRVRAARVAHELGVELEEWDFTNSPYDAYMVHDNYGFISKKATTRTLKRNFKEAYEQHELWIAERRRQNLPYEWDDVPLKFAAPSTHTPTSPPPK